MEVKEEKHPEGKWESHRVTGDVNHLELHLLPYSTYRFRVSGVNRLGRSDPSEISEAYSTLPTGLTHTHAETPVKSNQIVFVKC